MKKRDVILFSLVIAFSILFSSCARPEETPVRREEAVPPSTPLPPPPPPSTASLAPPRMEEARDLIARIYQNAVVIEQGEKLIAGDFNGDQSQDLAVVVRPSESAIEEINSELANWTLGDPTKVVIMTKTGVPPAPEPVRVEKGDSLLAIIHGYGPEGWRDKDAQQTYLLKNAIGAGMKLQSVKSATKTCRGKPGFPRLTGDVIAASLAGKPALLYWTGAKYAWCQPDR